MDNVLDFGNHWNEKKEYSDNERRVLSSCGAGKYVGRDGLHCLDCEEGKYSVLDLNNIRQCLSVECPVGSHCPAGSKSADCCELCPKGKYGDRNHYVKSCQDCDGSKQNLNLVSTVLGSTACTACTDNKVPNADHSECVTCSPGSYAHSNSNSRSCEVCQSGKFQSGNSCVSCPSLQASESGSTACSFCDEGKYYVATTGRYGITSTKCVSCLPGSSTVPGDTTCSKCPVGKYRHTAAAAACIDCVAGKFARKIGATAANVCQLCPSGSFALLPGSSDCTVCPVGQNSLAGATICTGGGSSGATTAPVQPDPPTQPKSPSGDTVHVAQVEGGSSWWVAAVFVGVLLLLFRYLSRRHTQKAAEATSGETAYEVVQLTSMDGSQREQSEQKEARLAGEVSNPLQKNPSAPPQPV